MTSPTNTPDTETNHAGPCAHIPMPVAVAALPRDRRGYPAPVTVPWAGGKPLFSSVSVARQLIIGKLRLCGICGNALEDGEPYYSVGDADKADLYEALLGSPAHVMGNISQEPGGHRECIIYAAIACPYLTSDGDRRTGANSAFQNVEKGERRGPEAAVYAYDGYDLHVDSRGVLFCHGALVEMHRYREGIELAETLTTAIEQAPQRKRPEGVLDLSSRLVDEKTIEAEAIRLLNPARVPASSQKHPRNAPCHCGSAVKFKHCHGRPNR